MDKGIKEWNDAEVLDRYDKIQTVAIGSNESRIEVENLKTLFQISMDIKKLEVEEKIKMEQLKQEEHHNEQVLKSQKIDSYMKNGIALAGILLTTGCTLFIYKSGMNYEYKEMGMITSNIFRNFVSKIKF